MIATRAVLAAVLLLGGGGAVAAEAATNNTLGGLPQRWREEATTMLGLSPPPLPRSLLSHTLGDGMVLQRAPQAARIYGYAPAGTAITTTFGGGTLGPSIADSSGTWRRPAGGRRVPDSGWR